MKNVTKCTGKYTIYRGGSRISSYGGGALIKIAPSGGRRENFGGISCEKSRFYDKKNHIFSNCGRRREKFWGISCEKSRFYAKKSYLF
jgi:hypothetical protein